MPFWVNPFTKNDRINFPGVVIPLSEARRDPAARPAGDNNPGADEKKLDRVGSEENGTVPSLPESHPMTIEALRAEIENDIAASGHNTAYDRTFMFSVPP